MTNDNNQTTNNTAMDENNDKTPIPAVSKEEYQETLGQMSCADIVNQLMRNGQSRGEAEAFADEVEEDR